MRNAHNERFSMFKMSRFKRIILFVLLISSLLSLYAQNIKIDTIYRNSQIDYFNSADIDNLMLDKMQQTVRLKFEYQDSLYKQRLYNDTTSISPFHVGYRDSILMAVERAELLHYVHYYGFDRNPQLWTKRLTSPDFSIDEECGDTLLFADNRLKKIGGIMVLIPPTIRQLVDVSDSELTAAMIETDKSLMLKSSDQLKIKVDPVWKHWYKEATILLQVTQNYITSNWYTGGSSSFAVLGIIAGKLDYNDFKRITWENSFEWREGTNTIYVDSVYKVNRTEDLFRLYSKFNYKAYSKIYYSLSAELQTQFFDTYKENTTTLVSSFLSPLRLNVNLGMDFKPVKGLSIAVSPVSYKFVYVNDTLRIKQTDFSVKQGRKSLSEVGSSLRIEYTYKPVREFSLDSKLYFYTNYKKVEADLEVILNFIFNQYFSTRVSLHPRYDNTVILSGDERAKIQFKELVSVGFSHRFR